RPLFSASSRSCSLSRPCGWLTPSISGMLPPPSTLVAALVTRRRTGLCLGPLRRRLVLRGHGFRQTQTDPCYPGRFAKIQTFVPPASSSARGGALWLPSTPALVTCVRPSLSSSARGSPG